MNGAAKQVFSARMVSERGRRLTHCISWEEYLVYTGMGNL